MKESIAKTFLSKDEQNKVTETVHQVEALTSGEIVPMVVSQSHSYPRAILIGALFFSIPTGLLLTSLVNALASSSPYNHLIFLAICTVCFPIFYFILQRSPSLKRLFLVNSEVDEEVQEGAVTAFFTEQLYKTEKENGILIYISVFEQRVWVLGDHGIDERISSDFWQQIVADLTSDIKTGSRGDAICTAIKIIGIELANHFPADPNDINELHDLIIRD